MSVDTVWNVACDDAHFRWDEGAGRLAGVLAQCSSLARLDLEGNAIGDEGIAMIRMSIPDRVQLSV